MNECHQAVCGGHFMEKTTAQKVMLDKNSKILPFPVIIPNKLFQLT